MPQIGSYRCQEQTKNVRALKAMLGNSRTVLRPLGIVFLVATCVVFYVLNVLADQGRTGPSSKCQWGVPCTYQDEVDLRLIILTFNRPKSLRKCLASTRGLVLDGDQAALEVWVDRDRDGSLDRETMSVITDFRLKAELDNVHAHAQSRRAGLHGQWLHSWRPREGGKGMALFLEDDVNISPYAYRWLKAVWNHYKADEQLAGVILQDDYIITASGRLKGTTLPRPKDAQLFMYKILMPWGFSPNSDYWKEFQDWYTDIRGRDPTFLPRVPEAGLYDSWFEDMIRANRTESMWTMWFNYFCHSKGLFVIYSNLPKYSGLNHSSLAVHRRENGLHFRGRVLENSRDTLLQHWDSSFVRFPKRLKRFNYDGSFRV